MAEHVRNRHGRGVRARFLRQHDVFIVLMLGAEPCVQAHLIVLKQWDSQTSCFSTRVMR